MIKSMIKKIICLFLTFVYSNAYSSGIVGVGGLDEIQLVELANRFNFELSLDRTLVPVIKVDTMTFKKMATELKNKNLKITLDQAVSTLELSKVNANNLVLENVDGDRIEITKTAIPETQTKILTSFKSDLVEATMK